MSILNTVNNKSNRTSVGIGKTLMDLDGDLFEEVAEVLALDPAHVHDPFVSVRWVRWDVSLCERNGNGAIQEWADKRPWNSLL